jgi:hypothetical protein
MFSKSDAKSTAQLCDRDMCAFARQRIYVPQHWYTPPHMGLQVNVPDMDGVSRNRMRGLSILDRLQQEQA